jgi:hypothetical protein
MRYLYTADGDEVVAYAPGRRDFFRASDDRLWAHESHDWLVAAESGELLAHRTGDVYYGPLQGERLYRLARDDLSQTPPPIEPARRSAKSRVLRSAGRMRRAGRPSQ